jgi:hypothetical protein
MPAVVPSPVPLRERNWKQATLAKLASDWKIGEL